MALGAVAVVAVLSAVGYRLFSTPTTVTVVGILTTSTPGRGESSTGWIISTPGGPVEADVSAVMGVAALLQLKNVTATGTYQSVNGKRVLVVSVLK